MVAWREMPEFLGVDLEDSLVRSWYFEAPPFRLTVELDARLLPEHPAFRAGGSGEMFCSRPARLIFDDVMEIEGLDRAGDFWGVQEDGAPAIDTFAFLRADEDGTYCFDAAWGEVRVRCAGLRLEITDRLQSAA
jgi:hypothetical protein